MDIYFLERAHEKKTQPEWIRLAILITAVSGMAGIIFYKNIYPVLCGK